MRALSRVLTLKIAVTVALWCGPLLLFPTSLLEKIGFPVGPSALFYRLLGMAYGSLLVGYGFGWAAARRGSYPRSAVWAGIVSNGGAFLLLGLAALQGAWGAWGLWAQVLMWTSLAATGLVTTGLLVFGPGARPRV